MVTGYFYSTLFLFIFLIFFSNKRKNLAPNCCWSLPGCPSPGNLLTSRKNRHQFVLAFSLTIETVTFIIFKPDNVPLAIPLSYVNWDSFSMGWVTRKIVAVNFYALYYYPIFLCVQQSSNFSRVLGACQCFILFAFSIVKLVVCGSDGLTEMAIPILAALVTQVAAWLLGVSLVFDIFKRRKSGQKSGSKTNVKGEISTPTTWLKNFTAKDDNILSETHFEEHVKYILTKPKERSNSISYYKWDCLKLFKQHPGFIYSSRVLSSSLLAFLIIYELLLILCGEYLVELIDNAKEASDNLGAISQLSVAAYVLFTGNNNTSEVTSNDPAYFGRIAMGILDGAWISLLICIIIVSILSIWNCVAQIFIYKNHFRKLLRGHKVNLQTQKLAASGAITSTLKYGSYRVVPDNCA